LCSASSTVSFASCSACSRFALTNHDSLIIADIQRSLLRARMIRQIHIV
jgi:hypothetical protein